jgi:lysophospholipase L1-like esterase
VSGRLRFVALGDSVTVGIGDRQGDAWRGWAHILADSLAATYKLSFDNLATIGATTARLRDEQLPKALELRPDLVSLVIGVNDTMRSTFDPAVLRAELDDIARRLTDAGARLLMVRFHDHGRVFGLPQALRKPLDRRINALNSVYDEIHRTYGGFYLDVATNPNVYTRAAWSVDRLHPSEQGHRWLARGFAELLHGSGLPLSSVPSLECVADRPSKWQDFAWLVTQGIPWVARRARDLGPWAICLVASELASRLRTLRPAAEPLVQPLPLQQLQSIQSMPPIQQQALLVDLARELHRQVEEPDAIAEARTLRAGHDA